MGLAAYRRKRDFKATAEPKGRTRPGARKRSKSLSFVVQQHHASRPHFDLRLEMDGVLKSWAVPKGPSLDPRDKRLAVQVEDHPLEYATFEGLIPEGAYGGGSVIVWDRGTWTLDEGDDPVAAHSGGSLKFTLKGKKLKGAWKLVRMHTKDDAHVNWLFMKGTDAHARDREEYDIVAKATRSVASGRTIAALDKERAAKKKRAAPARKKARRSPLPRAAESPAGAVPAPFPERIDAQLAVLVDDVPPGDDWIHEMKFDGYRILAFVDADGARLVTRNHHDWSGRFPELRDALAGAGLPPVVLDGEVVALDASGVSRFQLLQHALKSGSTGSLVYFVFDMPHLDGLDLGAVPLHERRRLLQDLVGSLPAGAARRVRFSEAIHGAGANVLREACRLHLEGIVSKRADSPVTPGRGASWRKVKCGHRQELVVGGFTDPRGARAGFGALLVGHFGAGGELRYAGKVGAGFDSADLDALHKQLRALEVDEPPFRDPPRERAAHWVSPSLVAEVSFTEWTSDGRLRHPVFVGLREDKEASDVKREAPRAPRPRRARERTPTAASAAGGEAGLEVAGVRITHPERVVFPDQGLTKGEIASYYGAIADQIMPLLVGRPLSLVRCPGGATSHCFFQKHLDKPPGGGLRAVSIKESSGEGVYSAVTSLEGLVNLVQLNTLELHAWQCRADNVERPDRLVFDLDPAEGVEWARVAEGARRVKGVFDELEMESFLMTSGGKGLHVIVPIERRVSWDDAKAFAREVASAMARAEPERYVANMSKAKRAGKIFVDYLRVQRGATSIVPYSTRARPGAPVAMPIEWKDVEGVRPDGFTVATAPAHVAKRRRDPWAGIAKVKQRLPTGLIVSRG